MTDQHPITPTTEQVQQWLDYFQNGPGKPMTTEDFFLAAQAAEWGANQELEACCDWVLHNLGYDIAIRFQAARRPKPQNRKQRALDALTQMEHQFLGAELAAEIRNALEELLDD